ncbi:hypothetical protein ABZ746_23390 [Streptomyces sp. NPDC020096]
MVAVISVISSLLRWASAADALPGWLLGVVAAYAGWILAGLVVASGVGAAGQVWWRRRAAAAVRDRVAVELVPAVTFNPTGSEVNWFAGQLASVPAAAGQLPRRAVAARVRLTCTDGQMRFLLEGPERAASLLRMPGYDQVEVIDTYRRSKNQRIRFTGAPPVRATDMEEGEQQ